MSTKVQSCQRCGKRRKLTFEPIRTINIYTSQQVFLLHMPPKQNMPIPEEDDNASENFGLHKDEKFILKAKNIEGHHTNLASKSFDIKSYIRDGLSGCTPQDRLFVSELSSPLKKAIQKYNNLKNGQEHYFWALLQLFLSG